MQNIADLQQIAEEKKAVGVAKRQAGLNFAIASFAHDAPAEHAEARTAEIIARAERFGDYVLEGKV